MECLAKFEAVRFLRKIFSWKYLPFVSAAVVLIDFYLGWDVVTIWYFSLLGVGIMLTCRDVTPIFSVFMLMGLMTSDMHTPSISLRLEPSDYYTRPYILAQMIVAITLLVGMAVTRIIESIVLKRFKLSPIFFGLCAFIVALLFNGVFAKEYYSIMNVVFALFLAVCFLGIFCFACGNIEVNEHTFERIAITLLALLAVLGIELLVCYCTKEVIVGGSIDRGAICFGWGSYNNFGVFVTICLPAPFYLAAKYKYGWLYTIVGMLGIVVAVFCMSRQVWLMGGIITLVSIVWLLVRTKGRARMAHGAVLCAAAAVFFFLMAAYGPYVPKLFSSLGGESLNTGSGRTDLWKEAIDKFLNYPVFGAGFFSRTRWVWGESGFANILPRMYHNTVIQLLECSGIVGFGAYAFHRCQTVWSLFKNFTHERFFIALVAAGIILTSLLDNHIFYLYPTIIYSLLLGVFALSQKKPSAQAKEGAQGGENTDNAAEDINKAAEDNQDGGVQTPAQDGQAGQDGQEGELSPAENAADGQTPAQAADGAQTP